MNKEFYEWYKQYQSDYPYEPAPYDFGEIAWNAARDKMLKIIEDNLYTDDEGSPYIWAPKNIIKKIKKL